MGDYLPSSSDQQPASAAGPASMTAAAPPPAAMGGGNVGRRALLLSVAVVAAAVATPFALEKGAELAADEIRTLLQRELGDLEGIALDEAIAIAELTRKAVELIVVPLANFLTTISGDGLQELIDTVTRAEQVLELAHLPTDGLPALAAVLTAWKQNESQLPIALQDYANTNIDGAETYLKAVKAKVDGQAAV